MPSAGSAARMRAQEAELRFQARDALVEPGARGGDLGRAVARMVVRRQGRLQRAQDRRRVAHQGDGGMAEARRLGRVDVEAHHRQAGIHAPGALRPVEPRADRQHRIGGLPVPVALGEGHGERVRGRQDAAPAAEGDHRRLQRLGDGAQLGRRILRAAADHDHRPLRAAQQRRRARHRLGIDRRRRRRNDRVERDLGHRGPGVDGAFQRDRAGTAAERRADRGIDQAGRLVRRADARGELGQVAQQAELVGDLVQMAVAAGRWRRTGSARPARGPAH